VHPHHGNGFPISPSGRSDDKPHEELAIRRRAENDRVRGLRESQGVTWSGVVLHRSTWGRAIDPRPCARARRVTERASARSSEDGGVPGRGSVVSFTRAGVSRSWFLAGAASNHSFTNRSAATRGDRECQRGAILRARGAEQAPARRAFEHRSAQRRRETSSASFHSGQPEADTVAARIRVPEIHSRDWADIGRTHLWFVDPRTSQGASGPPTDLATRAPTRT
jgi:hypothetical protein